jgi:tetratricopeptide (TPR) repeat protein
MEGDGMKTHRSVLPGLLVLLTAVVYANTWQNSFHYDDITSILQKPWIRGLDKIPDFIFSWTQRPLLILTFNLNFHFSGFEVWSWHLVNIVGHAVVVLLLYRLARLAAVFAGIETAPASCRSLPFLAAAVFAVHPLNTQSVTYISSRSEILAAIFYLGALVSLFEGVRCRKATATTSPMRGWLWFVAGLVCLLLGGFSKETIMTVPAMAFLFHFYFVSRATFREWLLAWWRWLALAGALLVAAVAWKHLRDGGILVASTGTLNNAAYALTQTFVIPFEYFRKTLLPFNLSLDVGFPTVDDWSAPKNYLGFAALALYMAGLVRVSQADRWAGFGLAWMLITVLPSSSFVPLLDVAVEHRMYLPLAGFALALSAGIHRLDRRSPAVPVLVLALLLCFAVGAIERNAAWKDEMSLWADVKKKAPRVIRAYNNLGEAYDKLERYDEAIAEFESALKLDPAYFFALNNLGNVYGKRGQFLKAIEYLGQALAVSPTHATAHYNLARALTEIGQKPAALEHYRLAVQHNPYLEQAHFNLGGLAAELGMLNLAVESYRKFLEMQPGNARARFALGNAYAQGNLLELALEQYRKATEAEPKYIFPYINRATLLLKLGKVDEAIGIYDQVLAIQPNIAGVHRNLGMIYGQLRVDPEKALLHFKESLRLEPNQQQADVIRGVVAEIEASLSGGTGRQKKP